MVYGSIASVGNTTSPTRHLFKESYDLRSVSGWCFDKETRVKTNILENKKNRKKRNSWPMYSTFPKQNEDLPVLSCVATWRFFVKHWSSWPVPPCASSSFSRKMGNWISGSSWNGGSNNNCCHLACHVPTRITMSSVLDGCERRELLFVYWV